MAKHDMKFHRKIGFPDAIDLPTGRTEINPINHAENRSDNHKFGDFDIPDEVYVHEDDVVELKTIDKQLWRFLIRIAYNDEMDICIVLELPNNKVVTAWRNYVDDTHDTLDESEYDHPDDF